MPETKTIKPVVSEERLREIVAEGADELDPKALAAAEQVYTETSVYPIVPANHDAALAQAIRAYLRAALRRSTETDKPGVRDAAVKLEEFFRFLEGAPVASGTCCCGNEMDQHSISDGHSPVDMWDYSLSEWLKKLRALSASPLTEEQPVTWQDIATAPKVADKTLLLRIEHMNFAIAPAEDKARWEEVVTAYWTDFNNGGWVWHGLAGLPTHWTPLPPLPRSTTGGAK